MALTIGCLFVLNGVDRLGVEALTGAESGKRHRTPLTPGLTIRRSRPLFPEQPQPRQPERQSRSHPWDNAGFCLRLATRKLSMTLAAVKFRRKDEAISQCFELSGGPRIPPPAGAFVRLESYVGQNPRAETIESKKKEWG
jgi:hypothetical protein